MGTDRNVVVLADDIDFLVGSMGDDIDFGIAEEKVRHDFAHRKLHGRHGCGAAQGAGRLIQPMAHGGFGQFGLAQHRHRVAIEFLAGIGHGELA